MNTIDILIRLSVLTIFCVIFIKFSNKIKQKNLIKKLKKHLKNKRV
jgi:hypothetical protein